MDEILRKTIQTHHLDDCITLQTYANNVMSLNLSICDVHQIWDVYSGYAYGVGWIEPKDPSNIELAIRFISSKEFNVNQPYYGYESEESYAMPEEYFQWPNEPEQT